MEVSRIFSLDVTRSLSNFTPSNIFELQGQYHILEV